MTIAFICVLIPVLLRKVKIKLTFRDFLTILPAAFLYGICFYSFQAITLTTLPSTEFGIVLAAIPIVTAILATIFLKDKTNGVQALFIMASVAGVVFLMLMRGASADDFNAQGVSFALLTIFVFSVVTILMRRYTSKYPAYTFTFVMTALGFVGYNVTNVIVRLTNGTIMQYYEPLSDWRFLLAVLFLGIAGMLGTSMLTAFALKYIVPTKAIVFSNMSTAITMFLGAVFLSEPLHWYHILGAVVIVVGVVGTNWASNAVREKRRAKRSGDPPK